MELREQSSESFDAAMPLISQILGLISKALNGDLGFFENNPLTKRRGSIAQEQGGKRKEAARQKQAQLGLEGSGAGNAELQNMDLETDQAVSDAIFSELERFLKIAPDFAVQVANIGTQGASNAARVEASREASNVDMFTSILRAAGIAAGTIFGGPTGGAIASGITGIFSGKTPVSPSYVGDVTIGGGFET